MRFFEYIYEDIVQKALEIDEPDVAKKYSDDMVKKRIDMLKTAISQAKKKSYVDDDSKEAVIIDLEDKLDKWQNLEKSTEPNRPPAEEQPPEDGEEKPEEEPEQEKEPPPKPSERDKEEEEEEEEEPKESRKIKMKIRGRRKRFLL